MRALITALLGMWLAVPVAMAEDVAFDPAAVVKRVMPSVVNITVIPQNEDLATVQFYEGVPVNAIVGSGFVIRPE
ncbi:MAG: hypothetical protein JOY70_07350, partial [Acidisphaera sp.]|nr:hypothetical protein [Acidisphaera sp.]